MERRRACVRHIAEQRPPQRRQGFRAARQDMWTQRELRRMLQAVIGDMVADCREQLDLKKTEHTNPKLAEETT